MAERGERFEITALLGEVRRASLVSKGGIFRPGKTYSATGDLAAYRAADGHIVTDPVAWHFSSTKERQAAAFQPWSCVRMRGHRASSGRLKVERLLKTAVDDPELLGLAEELKCPIVIEDPVLGSVTCDPKGRFFEFKTTREIAGDTVEFVIPPDGRVPDAGALAIARTVAAEAEAWRSRIFEAVTDQMLEECWLQQDRPVDRAAFQAELRLQTLTFDAGEDMFVAYLDGGETYYGHSIVADASVSTGKVGKAVIMG